MTCSTCALIKVLAASDRLNELLQARLAAIWNSAPGTPEHAEEEAIAEAIVAYEALRSSLPDVDPITVILEVMRDRGLRQRDMAHIFRGRGRTSEILNGKRPLTPKMAQRVAGALGLPVEALYKSAAGEKEGS